MKEKNENKKKSIFSDPMVVRAIRYTVYLIAFSAMMFYLMYVFYFK